MTPLTQAPQLRFQLPLDAARLLRARERVRDYLRTICTDEDLVDDVVLCVEEACTNAIRHSQSQDEVQISLAFDDGSLFVEVQDRGRGFDVATFDPQAAPDLMALGGRGLFLMSSLMDELSLHADDGLRVHMVKRGVDQNCAYPEFDSAVPHGSEPDARQTRMRALLEDIDEAFFALDWEYRLVHGNEAAGRLAGASAAALVGKKPLDVWPELAGTDVLERLRDAMELGRPSLLEWLTSRYGWLELRVYPTPTGVSIYARDIGVRKRAELAGQELLDKLRRNEERFRATFEQAAVGMGQLDLDGRYERVNDRFCEMLGYKREELEQLRFQDVTHEGDASRQQRVIDALVSGVAPTFTFDKRYQRKDGGVVWASMTLSLVHDAQGVPEYILSVAQDVTAQQQAVEAMRRYQLLSTQARDIMLFVRERDGRILEANQAAEAAYGYTRDELLGLTVLDLRAEGHWAEVQEQMVAAARTGMLFETVHRRADGSTFPVEVSSRGAVSLEGETVLLSVVRDVSERHALTEALATERDVLATVMANTSAQIAYLDEDLRVLLVNDAFARITGLEPDDLVGRHVTEVAGELTPDLIERVRAGEPVERSGMPRELPGQPERAVTFWDWRLVPVSGEDGRVQGFVLSQVEVTERVRRGIYSEGLSDVLERLGENRDPDELARILAQGVCEVLGADVWSMWEYDGEETWTVVDHGGHMEPPTRTVSSDEVPFAMEAFRTGGVVAVEECEQHWASSPSVRAARLRSVIAAPLSREASPFTGLFFSWHERARHFAQADLDFVARVAATTAAAMDDARLYRELEERGRFAAALNGISAAITSLLDYDQILTRVVRLATEALGAESSSVALLEPGAWVPRYAYNTPDEVIGVPIPIEQVEYANAAVAAKQAVVVDDCETDPRVDLELQRSWGVRAVGMAPLIVRAEVIGGIFLNYHSGPHSFAPLELEFIGNVAAIISGALESARLYEGERHVATTLQEAFVHPLPDTPGIEVAVTAQLAFEPELVGGDFYDVFELGDGRLAMLLGDVEGKGVRAARLTETVRAAVRTLALVDPSPGFILGKANELLLHEQSGQFVTAALLVVDPAGGEVVCASAGHPPAVVLSGHSAIELVAGPGVPLGTFEWRFEDQRLQLRERDVVLLYTDGLTEMRRDDELFGVERVVQAACALAERSLDDLVTGVRDAAVEFGGPAHDDLLVLAFRLRPER